MEKLKVTLLYDKIEDDKAEPGADAPVYKQALNALSRRGHEIKLIAAERNIKALVQALEKDDADVIFNLCESLGGIDRFATNVASLLELLGKPFTGTGTVGLTLAQDKALAKKIFQFHGIKYPRFSTMDSGQVEWSDKLKFPLFVKPLNQDSSLGIDAKAIVKDIKALMERISYIHTEIRAPALIEEYIEGREIYVGVLGNDRMEALPIVEWDFSGMSEGERIATAEAKWDKTSKAYNSPQRFLEDIPPDLYKRIQQAAVDACRSLKIQDYGRVDMRLRRSGDDWDFYVIEVNPNPYLEQKAEMAMAARKLGLNYPDLLERILELARSRKR